MFKSWWVTSDTIAYKYIHFETGECQKVTNAYCFWELRYPTAPQGLGPWIHDAVYKQIKVCNRCIQMWRYKFLEHIVLTHSGNSCNWRTATEASWQMKTSRSLHYILVLVNMCRNKLSRYSGDVPYNGANKTTTSKNTIIIYHNY